MHRFLQHVLPRGFMKVRYYGFVSLSFSMPLDDALFPLYWKETRPK
jgi:hypothetical protein